MKVLCDREQMLAAFGMVSGVAPARSPKPILQSLKFVASGDDGSILMATDLEVGVRLKLLGVKVDRPGAAILPTQQVSQILRSSTGDDELAFELDDSEDGNEALVIRGQRSEFRLVSQDPEEFPEPPDFEASDGHRVSSEDLRMAIRRTAFATDPDSTRYALGGVQMELEPEAITFVGTDGRRLARQIIPASTEGEPNLSGPPPVVPVKALKLIERNLEDDESVTLSAQAGSAVLVRAGRATIYTRLVEGRFPNYRDVFPDGYEARIPFAEVAPLLSAVEQAAIVTIKESRGIDFDFGGGLLKLSGQSADVGQAHIELPIPYEGPEVGVTFDAGYLIDALRTLDPEQPITAELIDSSAAAVFKTEDQYTYVVMPLSRDR